MKEELRVSDEHPTKLRVFVDSHVHLHRCYDFPRFLTAAARNFSKVAAARQTDGENRFVLCLTESAGVDYFSSFVSMTRHPNDAAPSWRFLDAGDGSSLVAMHPDCSPMIVVAGRQIVTAERLEVLGLGLTGRIEDGLAIDDVLNKVLDAGAVPVVPWGFGKWLGRRREIVRKVIQQFCSAPIYLGDNSGRPGFFLDPAEFALGEKMGMSVLPGSDPLPFSSEYNRAGRFGFYVDCVDGKETTWMMIRGMLRARNVVVQRFGSPETPFRFVRNQLRMQYLTRVSSAKRS